MRSRSLLAVVLAPLVVLTLVSLPAHAAPKNVADWTVATVPGSDGEPLSVDDDTQRVECPSADFCVLLNGYRSLTTLRGDAADTVAGPLYATDSHEFSALSDVACPSAGACYAIGTYSEGPFDALHGYRDALADGAWTAHRAIAPADDVACNADQCVEGGTQDVGVSLGTITDRAADGNWTPRAIVTPWQSADDGGFGIAIDSVTCPRPTGRCVALGSAYEDFRTGPRPVFFFRSGDVWQGVAQALPDGAVPSASAGVMQMSCPSDLNCIGVGSYIDTTHHARLFAERFVDGVLSAQRIATPRSWRAAGIDVASTSCVSMTSCAAVASSYGRATNALQTRLLHYDGTTWTTQTAPNPAQARAATRPYVDDVACASASLCVAVGSFHVAATPTKLRPAVWTWRLGQWSVRRAPLPADVTVDPSDDVSLSTIACPAPTRCVLQGTAGKTAIYAIARFVN